MPARSPVAVPSAGRLFETSVCIATLAKRRVFAALICSSRCCTQPPACSTSRPVSRPGGWLCEDDGLVLHGLILRLSKEKGRLEAALLVTRMKFSYPEFGLL